MGDEWVRDAEPREAQAGNYRRHRHDDVSLNSLLDGNELWLIELPDGQKFPVIIPMYEMGGTWPTAHQAI